MSSTLAGGTHAIDVLQLGPGLRRGTLWVWGLPLCGGVGEPVQGFHRHPQRAATVTCPLGHCARIAGEYIASTRLAGRLKRPGVLSRST